MKIRKRGMFFAALMLSASLLLGGCGVPKEAKEARLRGIGQMQENDFQGAIGSFEEALDLTGGVVGEFELDILKYRGEAEYRLGDYPAAAHTYDILADVDGEKPEYLFYGSAAAALNGEAEEAERLFKDAVKAAGGEEKAAEAPGFSPALSAMTEAGIRNGTADRTAAFCRELAAAGMKTPEFLCEFGMSLAESGKAEEAVSVFAEALLSADETMKPVLQYNMAAAYEKQGKFKEALLAFETYASEYGTDPALEKEIAFLKSR